MAVYRDSCKVGQPLSDGGSTATDAAAAKAAVLVKAEETEEKEKVRIEYRPVRKRLPRSRRSGWNTARVATGCRSRG